MGGALEALIDRLGLSDNPGSEQRVLSSLLLGLLYMFPGHPRLRWCVSRVTEMLDEELDAGNKLEAAMMLPAYCNLAVDRDRANVAVVRGSSLAERSEITPFSRLWWYLRLSLHLTLQGRYEEAIASADQADLIARTYGFHHMPTIMSLVWIYRTIAMVAHGDVRGAQISADEVFAAAHCRYAISVCNVANARVYMQCATGNDEALAQLGVPCIESARATGMVYLDALAQTYHAMGLALTQQHAALPERTESLRSLVRGTCFAHFEIDAALIETWYVLRHERRELGLEMLRATLVRARAMDWRPGNLFRATKICREVLAEAIESDVEADYVTDIIAGLRLAPPAGATDRWPWPVRIHALGRFEVIVDGAPLQFAGKAPRKPLALLKAIVAMGTNGVPAASLIDVLWPDEEGDAARKSLDVTVGRLRKLLGRSDAILVSDEAVTLNAKLCWVDAQSFAVLSESATTPAERRRASGVYAGTFLPGDVDTPWSARRREQLRSRFVRLVETIGAAA